jgi:phospholipase/carboxylesterase
MQSEHVRHAVFADHDESARFDDDRATCPADLGVRAIFIVSALGRPTDVTNRRAERDTDLAQRKDLGLPCIAHRTDDTVRLGDAAQLAQQFAHQALEIHAPLKGITGGSPRQTRVASGVALELKSERMKELKLGRLHAHVCGGTDREGGGSGPIMVLMHGYGAPGTDLVSLWRALAVPKEVRFVFPEAPLELGFGGRAWWPIDMVRLQDRFTKEGAARLVDEVPPGIDEARAAVLELLDVLERDFAVRPDQIVIGGFSQGAMLATDTVLRSTRAFAGLAIMSGTLVSHSQWLPLMAARKGLPVLQSHGRADPVLPFAIAEQLRDELGAAGVPVEFIPFNGGHGIPESVLDGLARLLQRVANTKSA